MQLLNTNMTTKNNNRNNFEKELDEIFSTSNDEEKIRFEEMVINSNMIDVIKQLMKLNNIKTRKELAAKMGVSPAFITKMFRGDKNFNVNFLAKAQRVFKTSFEFNASTLIEHEQKLLIGVYEDFEKEYSYIDEEIMQLILEQESMEEIHNKEARVIYLFPQQTPSNVVAHG